MKITDIRFGMLRVPLKTPFKTALRTVDTIEDIIVTVHTDTGNIGYGEAPATAVITGDTHGSIIEAIKQVHRAAADRRGDRESQSHHAADPGRAREELQRQGRGRDRGLRPVRPAVQRAALQDARRRRSGDHDGHHDQRRLHRQDGRGLDRGGRARLRVAEDQGRQGHRRRHRARQGDLRCGRRTRAAAARREPGLDREAGGVRAADAGGCRRAPGAGRAAGQGARPRRHEVRHRARPHADHGGRKRVRSDRGHRADPHARRGHHQHQAHEDRRHCRTRFTSPTSRRCTGWNA